MCRPHLHLCIARVNCWGWGRFVRTMRVLLFLNLLLYFVHYRFTPHSSLPPALPTLLSVSMHPSPFRWVPPPSRPGPPQRCHPAPGDFLNLLKACKAQREFQGKPSQFHRTVTGHHVSDQTVGLAWPPVFRNACKLYQGFRRSRMDRWCGKGGSPAVTDRVALPAPP